MTPNRSLIRVAAVTGVAAFLFSFAHVSPAAAQTTTRVVKSCVAFADVGTSTAECTVQLPFGTRFIIESATFGGSVDSSQKTIVEVRTLLADGTWPVHYVPGGFQVLSGDRSWFSGAIPGLFFAEATSQYSSGKVRLRYSRASTAGWGQVRMTLSGYLEDMY